MTTRIPIKVVGGSYTHKSTPFDAQETINMYVEKGGKGSKSPDIMLRFPGLKPLISLGNGTGQVRLKALYETSNHRCFTVRGTALIEISSSFTEFFRGNLNSSEGAVSMTDNGIDLVIADGTNLYTFTLSSNSLSVITDTDAPQNTPVVDFVDGYIFGFNPDSTSLGAFSSSNLNDATDWLSTDTYFADGSPDNLVALIVCNQKVMVFGSKSYEWYYNTGTLTGTFKRVEGTVNNIGCASTHSVATMNGRVFWIGAASDGHGIVYMSDGYGAQEISTKPLEQYISSLADITDTIGFTIQVEGHYFYILTFISGDRTYIYDLTENEWTRIAYRDDNTGIQGRHRMIASTYFNGKLLAGDYILGIIHELSTTTYTDNTYPQLCERIFTHIEAQKNLIFWQSLELDIQNGVGETNGDATDPFVQLRWSDDGGRNYGNWVDLPLGATGEFTTRVKAWGLGASRNRTYHLRYAFPTPYAIQGNAIAEVNFGKY